MSFFKCYWCCNIDIELHFAFRNLDYFLKKTSIDSWCFKNMILNKRYKFQKFQVPFCKIYLDLM